MNVTGAQRESPARPETLILRSRRHGRVLVLPVLVMLAVAGAGGYFVGSLPEEWMNWAAGLGGVAIVLLLGVGPLLAWLSNRVTITSTRVIVRRGFFVHRRSEIPLSRIREVRTKRGPIQRAFGSGSIELLSGADSVTVIKDVPSPTLIVDALQELIEENYLSASASMSAEGGIAHSGVARGDAR